MAATFSIGAIAAACPAQVVSVPAKAKASVLAVASTAGTSGSIMRVAAAPETLHVIVGHSLFLNTRSRLRRIYVADPTILNSDTISPNQILVSATAAGVSSLILLDETGQAQSYIVSSDLDVGGLRLAMAEAMRGDTVVVEGSGSRIILSGKVSSQALADTAVKLATLYAKDVVNVVAIAPTHPKQVRLKVRILEVDRSKATQMGINLFSPGGNSGFIASSTTAQFPSTSSLSQSGSSSAGDLVETLTTSNPLNFLLYSTKANLGATVQDLEGKQVLQILAEPTITTISGEKASFLAGGEFPFPMVQPGGAGGTTSISVSFRPYGVKLEFTPIVNEDGTIRLKVAPEVSALDYTNAVSVSGYSIPALSTRRAETEVELRSNQSFAISGLLDQRTTDILSKTPGASSIPILGALFKSKSVNHAITELVVIITPTLVDPLSEMTEPAQPDLPIPTLNPGTFDKSLGKLHNPQPAAPPINPALPPPGYQVPSASTSFAPATVSGARKNEDGAPTPSRQSAPVSSAPDPVAASASATKAIAPSVVAPPAVVSQSPAKRVVGDPPTAPSIGGKAANATDTPARSMVEIMVIPRKAYADATVASLKSQGYTVAVNRDSQDSLLRLEVGPFASRTEAEVLRHKLLHDGYNATVK